MAAAICLRCPDCFTDWTRTGLSITKVFSTTEDMAPPVIWKARCIRLPMLSGSSFRNIRRNRLSAASIPIRWAIPMAAFTGIRNYRTPSRAIREALSGILWTSRSAQGTAMEQSIRPTAVIFWNVRPIIHSPETVWSPETACRIPSSRKCASLIRTLRQG